MSGVLTMKSVPRDTTVRAPGTGGPLAPVGRVINLRDGRGEPRAVAHVERELPPGGIPEYLAARKNGARSFVLWADPDRRQRLATLVTASVAHGVWTYQVLGAQDEPIGTLVREKALSGKGLRTRWTVTQTGCPAAVGYKGRIFWWYVWWLLLPVQAVVATLALLSGNGDVARGPRRIVWRTGEETPLEFRSDKDELHLHAPWCDWRLGAALVALVPTFEGWLGHPWDDGKK
ncbi:hypothetical protein [Streptomyces sp. NPDC052179]|uniref:hypothetical protein n=1 Tax=Streptomyces sp. NPDC052179 TaxID=3155680 RepID=UPI00342BBB04